jgi:hypothetical protein
MENTNRQRLFNVLSQRGNQNFSMFYSPTAIEELEEAKKIGFKIKQSEILLMMRDIPDFPATNLYQYLIYVVFDTVLACVGFDKDSRTHIELLSQPIASMLNKYLATSIDLETVENNPLFLYNEVPKYLDSWKDTELLFNNFWEILKDLGFTDDEIGYAWGGTFLSPFG